MDIVSSCNLRVGSCTWPLKPAGWMLTIVCKATFRLEPGESVLAPEQEEIRQDDVYRDGDPAGSLRWPTDLVPVKHGVDVWVTGSVHAPAGQPFRSLIARLAVGEIDKSIEVCCQRTWMSGNQVVQGPPIVSLPLCYKRAAGGPDTSNPVGLTGSADSAGRVQLPQLQQVGAQVRRGSWYQPVGFGPLPPHWPSRTERLQHHRQSRAHERWREQPLPEDFDLSFFNAAPPDQQLVRLADRPRLTLEHLHPHYHKLITQLPDARPLVTATLGGRPPEEIDMAIDTLGIDSDRGFCIVVWRGLTLIGDPQEHGQVLISRRRTRADEGSPQPRAPAQPQVPPGPARPDLRSEVSLPKAGAGKPASGDPWSATPLSIAADEAADDDEPEVQTATTIAPVTHVWPFADDEADDDEPEVRTATMITPVDATIPLDARGQLAAGLQPVLPFTRGAPQTRPVSAPLAPAPKGGTALLDIAELQAARADALPFAGSAKAAPPAASEASAGAGALPTVAGSAKAAPPTAGNHAAGEASAGAGALPTVAGSAKAALPAAGEAAGGAPAGTERQRAVLSQIRKNLGRAWRGRR